MNANANDRLILRPGAPLRGTVKVLGEHKFTFPGNWKIQLENTTDACGRLG